MSANLLTLAKWLPATILEHEATFQKCKTLRDACFMLIAKMIKLDATIKVTISKNDNRALPIKVC